MMVQNHLTMTSLSPHLKYNSQRCMSFPRSGSCSHQGRVCVRHTPTSVALMIGLVYESRMSTSGNESSMALVSEGFLEPRWPCKLVRNSLCRSSCHIVRKLGSALQVGDWVASRSALPSPHFTSLWVILVPQRVRLASSAWKFSWKNAKNWTWTGPRPVRTRNSEDWGRL